MFHCNWSQGWVHRHCTWALGAKMTFSQYIKTQIEVLRCNRRFWQFDFWGYTSIQCFPLNGTYTFLRFLRNTGREVSSSHWHLTVLLPLTPFEMLEMCDEVDPHSSLLLYIHYCIELPLWLARVETEKLSQMHDSTKWSSHIHVQFINKSFILVIYYQLIPWSSLEMFRHILAFWNYAIQHVIQNFQQSV